jgi:hypothetical protein
MGQRWRALNRTPKTSEGTVKNRLLGFPLAIVLFSPFSFTGTSRADSNLKMQYVPGTVLHVQEQETQSNYIGGSPTDAPLQADVHLYDVSVRLNCGTYVGQYKSGLDYLPSVLTSNPSVEVRLQKHVMYVKVPGDQEYRMAIVEHPTGVRGCQQR